ncbi:AlbA family DNA-binding domain-containing protein [Niallia sp. 03091]|uniref:AlbA family DNA-binding domain-containing protein n=1 Tax=Niallia sp. 03091 TaxID=3458059 RepID=UPI004044F0F2
MLYVDEIKMYSRIIKNGGTVENPKIELKKEWWDFSQNKGQEEFIKDVTAMANTQGDDGYIIIGLDGKNGDLFNSPFPQSNYDDPSKIIGLIYKKVIEPMDVEFYEEEVEGKNIIIVHIPKSQNKPHVIKSFNNRHHFIPVRKGTSINAATKYDLDLMYSERDKIVIPPYRLAIHLSKNTIFTLIPAVGQKGIKTLGFNAHILNTGQNINMVKEAKLVLIENERESYKFEHNSFFNTVDNSWRRLEYDEYIKIPPNDILKVNMGFIYEGEEEYSEFREKDFSNTTGYLELTDVSGAKVRSDIVSFSNQALLNGFIP